MEEKPLEYLIYYSQIHESFREPELRAVADLYNIDIEIVESDLTTPFLTLRLPSPHAARTLISRLVLADSIHELWGHGETYAALHADIARRTAHLWPRFRDAPFRFQLRAFRASRSPAQQRAVFDGLAFLPLLGPIRLRDHEAQLFSVFEVWDPPKLLLLGGAAAGLTGAAPGPASAAAESESAAPQPSKIYFARALHPAAPSARSSISRFSLKQRVYINTTSMDAELALVTANLAQAAPGKVVVDPFAGTGGFLVTAARFGAAGVGADIDGRVMRGDGGGSTGRPKGGAKGAAGGKGGGAKTDGTKLEKGIKGNFQQYGLQGLWLDGISSDLTNSPFRRGNGVNGGNWVDAVICDPPYGIREGCRVLGSVRPVDANVLFNGELAYKKADYIPPKKPYSFEALLQDILYFSAEILVDNGRLAMWMPTCNEDDVDLEIPSSPYLELSSVCVQSFNNWSRRLLTYVRKPQSITGPVIPRDIPAASSGKTADELNNFRKRYFKGFRTDVHNSKSSQDIQKDD